jgi:hypothetical protein
MQNRALSSRKTRLQGAPSSPIMVLSGDVPSQLNPDWKLLPAAAGGVILMGVTVCCL